jgi:ketosteroid isomerase-like protein
MTNWIIMISIKKLIVCSFLFLAVMSQARSQSGTEARPKAAAIIAAMKNSENDWNTGNLDNFMKMYTDSSTMMYPTGPVGLSTIRNLYQTKYFNGKMPKQNLHYSDMQVTMLGENYALLTGKFTLSGNNLPERSGVYSLVMVYTKDGWKILHDHSG